uniref:Peptidase aspartic putative domain-containing protein n=1 Tax=Anopheles atroparvus TaxID=41427 RepID=A0A182JIZ3_ANOAO
MERGETSQPLATAGSMAEEQSLAPTGMLGSSPLATVETGPGAPLAPAEEAHPDPLANSTARPPRRRHTNTSLSHSLTGDDTYTEDLTILNDLRRREIEIERRLLKLELEQIAVEKSLIAGRHSIHLHQEALKMAEVEMVTPSRLPGLSTSASTSVRSVPPGLATGQSFGATAATPQFLNAGPRPSRLTFMGGSGGSRPRETMATAFLNQSQILARQGGNKELPRFSGRPEEWAIFIASFESSTDLCGFSDEENMLRLQKALSGKALDAVRSRLLHPANLKSVIETLRMLFGRPEIIIHQIMQQIRKIPAPRLERMESIVNFGVAVQDMCATIEAAGVHEYLCDATLLYELAEKLPDTLRLDWARHRLVLKWVTLAEFGSWLNELVHAASLISLPSISGPRTERNEFEPRKEKPRYHLNVHQIEEQKTASSSRNAVCPVCSGSCSGLTICEQFSDLAPQERWNTIRRLGLCRKCLTSHGSRWQVSRPCGKNGCGYFHHPLLHDDVRYRDPRRTAVESIHTHSVSSGNVLLPYVPITVYGKNRTVDTFAFLDSGSTGTFVERGLAEELNLEGKPFPLCLKWTGDTIREESDSIMFSLNISALGGMKIHKIPKAHTMQRLSLPAQSVCASDLASRYGHLKDIPLPYYTGIKPRIIIGVDNFHLARPQRYAEGGEHEPIAVKTPLGWMLYGPCTGESGTNVKGNAVAHSFHICDCSIARDKALDTLVKEHFSIESLGISKNPPALLSKDNERALAILSTETKLKEGRFETGLLWRFGDVQLPCSKSMTLKRYACLRKRMENDAALASAIKDTMRG